MGLTEPRGALRSELVEDTGQRPGADTATCVLVRLGRCRLCAPREPSLYSEPQCLHLYQEQDACFLRFSRHRLSYSFPLRYFSFSPLSLPFSLCFLFPSAPRLTVVHGPCTKHRARSRREMKRVYCLQLVLETKHSSLSFLFSFFLYSSFFILLPPTLRQPHRFHRPPRLLLWSGGRC